MHQRRESVDEVGAGAGDAFDVVHDAKDPFQHRAFLADDLAETQTEHEAGAVALEPLLVFLGLLDEVVQHPRALQDLRGLVCRCRRGLAQLVHQFAPLADLLAIRPEQRAEIVGQEYSGAGKLFTGAVVVAPVAQELVGNLLAADDEVLSARDVEAVQGAILLGPGMELKPGMHGRNREKIT